MSEVVSELQDYLLYIYIVAVAFFVLGLLYVTMKNRGKIQVRVKTPSGEKVFWKKVEADGETIIMQKGGKKKANWSFTFSNKSLSPIKRFLSRSFAIEVFYYAPKAVEWNFDVSTTEQPKWTKDQSTRFINAKILERAGQEPKEKSSGILWIIAILVVANIILTLFSSGRIHIG